MRTDLQAAARQYVDAGLHILALTGKRPNGRVHGERWSWDDSFHGVVSDEDVEPFELAFSEGRGTTGIAILIPPDFLVADVDSDRAAALLKDLGWQHSDESVIAKTKNGLHVWLYAPGADRNRWLGDGEQPDPGRTLLFKGLGGYVVAPPSLHFAADGTVDGTYEWVWPLVSPAGNLYTPDTIPAEAAERFARNDLWTEDRQEHREAISNVTMVPVEGKPWYDWTPVATYALEGLENAIINAADGNQNNIIHWAAMACREEGVPYSVAMERLMAAALKGGHPRNRAHDTIKGAYKRAPRG